MTKILTYNSSRSKRISAEKKISALFAVLKIGFLTLITIYVQGALWYRFSYKWQHYLLDEPHNRTFVHRFGFDITQQIYEDEDADSNWSKVWRTVIKLMYFFLTTLSTVGYGDFFPSTIGEKIVGIFVEIVGVSLFSILMNLFIQEVFKLRRQRTHAKEVKLT